MIGPNLSAWSVRERALTLFLIITIAVACLYAFFKMGRGEDPTFTVKVLAVTAIWPGRPHKKCVIRWPTDSRNACRSCVTMTASRPWPAPAS